MQPSASSGSAAANLCISTNGAAQIDRHVEIPARAVCALQVVVLEGRSVVDEAAEGPEGIRRARHQGFDLGLLGEVGPERYRAAAGALDAGDDVPRGLSRLAMMHRDRPAVVCQRLGNGAADSRRGAGDQSRPRHCA